MKIETYPHIGSVAALTQGNCVPSTRFRWNQYVHILESKGLKTASFDSRIGAYPPASKIHRPFWAVGAMVENALRLLKSNKYDIRFVQRNLLSTYVTFEPFLKSPFVFDVDDAIFFGKRGDSANKIALQSQLIICGNNYLANHFDKYGKVVVLPTAVDADRFSPHCTLRYTPEKIIGWSGTSSNFKYLYAIESALRRVLNANPGVKLKVLSDASPRFKSLNSEQVIFERWSIAREVDALREFTVGIMPLTDDVWTRGKCSFKMLTYMSVGLPVVVSPVGMNFDLLNEAFCGFGPRNEHEWYTALSTLLQNPSLSQQCGVNGRELVLKNYSTDVVGPKLATSLSQFI